MIPLILAALLSHPDFTVRESASASLERLGPPVLPLLDTFSPSCPEAQHRAAVIAERIRARAAEQMAFVNRSRARRVVMEILAEIPPPLYIDALTGENREQSITHYLGVASLAGVPSRDREADAWPAYSAAAKLWAVDQILDGMPEFTLRDRLLTMHQRSAKWDKEKRWEP